MLKQVLERTVAELAQRFEMTWRISYRARRKRVAVFVSKLDHCLFDILIRHQSGAQQLQPCVLERRASLAGCAAGIAAVGGIPLDG